MSSGSKSAAVAEHDSGTEAEPRKAPRDKEDLLSPGRAAEILDTRHEAIVSAIRQRKLRARRIEGSRGRDSYVITAGALRDYRLALVREYKESQSKRRRAYAEAISEVVI